MISIYKPNKKNEGCACSFSLGFDGRIYLNAVQQVSWDDTKRTGSFADNAKNKDKSISVKFNEFEAGGIVNAIDSYIEYSTFHSFDDNKTQISLKPWEKSDGTRAFGLRITRNSTDVFKLPIEPGEAVVIRQFLIFCMNKKFVLDEKKKDSNSHQ